MELIARLTKMSQPSRILIVDDDPIILRVLSNVLAPEGYVLATAVNGGHGFQTPGASSRRRDWTRADPTATQRRVATAADPHARRTDAGAILRCYRFRGRMTPLSKERQPRG